jgi:hypothetical protein
MSIGFEIKVSGPFLTGRPEQVLADMVDDCLYEVGNAALERWHFHLDASIKHPTPYYETQIIQQRQGMAEVVHDRGIIYGPWLEGTSSRNARSRFKGYASARKATSEVERDVPSILQRVINRHLGRLS